MNSLKIISLSLLLVACGDKGGSDDSGSSDGNGGSTDNGAFAPQEGAWDITPGATEDGCGIGIFDDDEGGVGILAMGSDGVSFTFQPELDDEDTGGEIEPFNCTLDGQDFTCIVDMGEDAESDIEGIDATIINAGSMGGAFSNETTGELVMEMTIDCEGADCGDVAEMFGVTAFPCTASQTYGMAAQ